MMSMFDVKMISIVLIGLVLLGIPAQGQGDRGDVPVYPEGPGKEASCSGSVTGAILITAFIFIVIIAAVYYFFLRQIRTRESRKLDPEAANKAAYDNPLFTQEEDDAKGKGKTASPVAVGATKRTQVASIATNTTETLERGKTTIEKVLTAMMGSGKIGSSTKTKDDQCMEPQQVSVPLQGHDFAGLGFKIHGSLREGIFVKEVLQRGPANESGQVAPGDRLMALTVVTDHMVFEDALTILSYASPYPVLLHLEKGSLKVLSTSTLPSKTKMSSSPHKGKPSPLCKDKSVSSSSNLVHPTLRGRSQSFEDLVKIGKIDINKVKLGELASPSLTGNFIPLNSGLSRAENIKLVQRSFETRHSERAIDVPGVKPKSSKKQADNVSPLQSRKDDVSVEIHQPMRSHVEIDMPDFEVSPEKDSPKQKVEKTSSKAKFGVKVLPELDVIKKKNSSDSETSKLSGKQNSGVSAKVSLKSKDSGEKDMDAISPIESDSDSSDLKQRQVPEPSNKPTDKGSHPSPTKEKKKLGEKLSFGPFSFGKSSKDSDKEEPVNKEEKSKSKFGLNFDVPDISIPGFGKSKKAKTETKSAGVDTQSKENDTPEVTLATSTSIKNITRNSSENENIHEDRTEAKMKSTDMTFPSMDLKMQIMGDSTVEVAPRSSGKETQTSSRIPVVVRERSISPDKTRKMQKRVDAEIQERSTEVTVPNVSTNSRDLKTLEVEVPSMLSAATKDVPQISSSISTEVTETPDVINLQLHSDKKTIKMEDIDAQINSLESEAFSLARDNLSSEKKPGANENSGVSAPDFTPPKATTRMIFSDPFSDVRGAETYNVPSADMLEAGFIDEINATDTTKKMKYGIRLEGQDMSSPTGRSSQRLTELESDRWANNQSDEVKSLNLRAMSPGNSNMSVSTTDTSFVSAANPSYTTEENIEFSSPGVLNASDEKKMKVIGVNVMPSTFNIQGVKLKRTNTEESEDSTNDINPEARLSSSRMSVSEFAFSDFPVQYDLSSTSTPIKDAHNHSGISAGAESLEITPIKPPEESDEHNSHRFGSAFGFKGFKHHIGLSKDESVDNSEISDLMQADLQHFADNKEKENKNPEQHSSSDSEETSLQHEQHQEPISDELKGRVSLTPSNLQHKRSTSSPGFYSDEDNAPNHKSSQNTSDSDDEASCSKTLSDSSETKSKSSTHGSKGFKSFKGKVKSEFAKIRHDSLSSEDESLRPDYDIQNEKRKKSQKKKDKKIKIEEFISSDPKYESKHSSSPSASVKDKDSAFARSSDSWDSDSERESSSTSGSRRKRKTKGKKKSDEHRVVSTGVKDVTITSKTSVAPVHEEFSVTSRKIHIDAPTIEGEQMTQVNVSRHRVELDNAFGVPRDSSYQQDPKTYVVVKEMRLKQVPKPDEPIDIDEVMEKVTVDRKVPRPLLQEERVTQAASGDTDGGSWGSDSDTEKLSKIADSYSENSVKSKAHKKRALTDSDELKRKATSLGDLSRLHEGGLGGSLLERAVSLDLKNASGENNCLHVRRLQLPDSSATSIEEVDEVNSPTKKQDVFGLKASSRWGTLEEALQLDRRNGLEPIKVESVTSVPTNISLIPSTEGVSISNIEISGDRGASVTALSSDDGIWDERRDDEPPSLPTSPIPTGKTTITVVDTESTRVINPKDYRGSDSNIVIVGSDSSILSKNMRNAGVQMSHFSTSQPNIISYTEHTSSYPKDDFLRTIRSFDSQSQEPLSMTDDGKVTVTMVTSEDTGEYLANSSGPTVAPKPRNRPHSSPQEMLSFDSGISTPVVTVNTDWIHENGGSVENSDHNLSDEYITPDCSPQKSMTQITLDGPGLSGYTVTEGPFSRTVIVSNPDLSTSEVTVQDQDLN